MRNIDSLKHTSQFREVYEKGRSAASSLLVLYVLETGGEDKKLGISVSKKVGNSVIRHRVTRIIRESYLKLKPDLPAGYSLVVVARVRSAGKGFSDIYGALLSLCKKMNLIQK